MGGDRVASAMQAEPTPADGQATSSRDAIPAQRLIFWLFVTLAVGTAAALWVFLHAMGDCDRDGVPDARDTLIFCQDAIYDGTHVVLVVQRALAADLASPVIVWFLLAGIGARGAERKAERIFWFAGALPAGLMVMATTLILLFLVGGP